MNYGKVLILDKVLNSSLKIKLDNDMYFCCCQHDVLIKNNAKDFVFFI